MRVAVEEALLALLVVAVAQEVLVEAVLVVKIQME
jgi:hypothetical protein